MDLLGNDVEIQSWKIMELQDLTKKKWGVKYQTIKHDPTWVCLETGYATKDGKFNVGK